MTNDTEEVLNPYLLPMLAFLPLAFCVLAVLPAAERTERHLQASISTDAEEVPHVAWWQVTC